jgi:hypothetical protein
VDRQPLAREWADPSNNGVSAARPAMSDELFFFAANFVVIFVA